MMIAEVAGGKRLKDLKEYAELADHFGVPVWVMFIPDLPREMLDGQKLKGLVQHVEEHVAARGNMEVQS